MGEINYMAEFGARLIANGYSILPIAPGTKKPGRYRSGAWGEFPGWPQYGERCPTDLEVATWSKWPGAGIGVVGGAVAAVDIDIVEDSDLAFTVEKLCREHLGDSPALRIGRAPKRLLVYRAATPFKGIKRHPLEVLCAGQQFVAYAVHPDTGAPYVWPEEGLADLDIDSLPEITEAQALAFLDAAMALIPERLRPARLETGAGEKPATGLAQEGTLPAIKSALAWLPNADLDYDSWMRVGMALKGALGEAGADLFAIWSGQAGKNDPGFTNKSWSGFNPTSIGAGTIYHMAMERGWKPDATLILDGSVKADPVHPAAGLLAAMAGEDENSEAVEATPAQIAVPPAPSLDRLDGVLKLMVDHIVASAIRPQPWLAVGASLTALGTLMGRKVRTESNLRSNLNVVGIAESGGGKDHARKAIKEIFTQARLEAHLGGERIASGAGLISALTRQPSSLFQIDEFGRFMANVVDKRRAPKHLSEIWDLFTELATSAGTTFMGAEYADQKERPRQDIIEPCTSVHGVSAPGPFWDALSSGSLQDGSLARFLVFRSEDDIPDRNRRPASLSQLPKSLLKGVKAVATVTHVNLFPLRVNARGSTIPAIYGHTSRGSSRNANPNGCFWKTSPIISTSVIARSEASWKAWATGLRKDCLRRQKSARRINASGCLSSRGETNWPTPRASANENRQTRPTPSQLAGKHGMNLATKAVMWPTPQTDSFRTRGGARKNEKGLDRMARDWPTPMASDGCKPSGGNRRSADLTHVASMWPTPLARDWKGTNSPEHVKQQPPARNHMDQLANFAVYSRQALTISGDGASTSDQRRSLNPAFVEALMGWPVGWTGFGSVATAWFPWLQRMRSEFLRLGSMMMDDEAAL